MSRIQPLNSRLTVAVSPRMAEELRRRAVRDEESVSTIVRQAIRQFLATAQAEPGREFARQAALR